MFTSAAAVPAGLPPLRVRSLRSRSALRSLSILILVIWTLEGWMPTCTVFPERSEHVRRHRHDAIKEKGQEHETLVIGCFRGQTQTERVERLLELKIWCAGFRICESRPRFYTLCLSCWDKWLSMDVHALNLFLSIQNGSFPLRQHEVRRKKE